MNEPPQSVVDHRASGVLELVWLDGNVSRLPHALLRSRCRCGGCEQQRRHLGGLPETAAETRIEDIRPVGDKAVNLVFSDGHGRGIYPWAYLRQIADEHSDSREQAVPSAIASGGALTHA